MKILADRILIEDGEKYENVTFYGKVDVSQAVDAVFIGCMFADATADATEDDSILDAEIIY